MKQNSYYQKSLYPSSLFPINFYRIHIKVPIFFIIKAIIPQSNFSHYDN